MNFNQTSAKGTNATATDAADNGNQAEAEKFYTQQEVNDMMAGLKASVTKKALKPYEDLGDPEELRQLRSEAEQRAQEQHHHRRSDADAELRPSPDHPGRGDHCRENHHGDPWPLLRWH